MIDDQYLKGDILEYDPSPYTSNELLQTRTRLNLKLGFNSKSFLCNLMVDLLTMIMTIMMMMMMMKTCPEWKTFPSSSTYSAVMIAPSLGYRTLELQNVNFFYTDHFCPTKFIPRKSA